MLKRPMLTVSIFSILTAVTAFYIRPLLLSIAVVIVILSVVLVYLRRQIRAVIIAVMMLLLIISTLNTYNKIDRIKTLSGSTVTSSFTVVSRSVYFGEDTSLVEARVTDGILPRGIKVRLLSDENLYLKVGEKITASVTVSPVSRNYRKSNYSDGIYASGNIQEITSRDGTNLFYYYTDRVSEHITDSLYKHFSSDIAATLNAIIIGDQSGFTAEFRDQITDTGVNHVMVVSGMHLAILLGSLFGFLDRLFYNRFIKFLLSVTAVLFIVAVCGFSISIIRAGLTFVICAAAGLFRRENDSLNSLGLAVYLIMLFTPFAVFSLAFQLSVLSTFGVIVLAPFYNSSAVIVFGLKSKPIKWLINTILTTVSATLMVMPILLLNFGYVSVIAVISNLLVTYAVTYALTFAAIGLLFGLLPFFDFAFHICFIVSGLCAKYVNAVIVYLSQIPFALVTLENPIIRYGSVLISVLLIVLALLFMYSCKVKEHLLKLKKIKEVGEYGDYF